MEKCDPSDPAAANGGESTAPHFDERLVAASCLRCGYSLRGLTENRCPECGTPFDPDLIARGYLPEWPRLMAWYVGALLVVALSELLSAAVLPGNARSLRWMAVAPLRPSSQVIVFLATLILAPVALAGLKRRVDWGRKAALAMFFIQAVPPFFGFVGDAYRYVDARMLGTPYHMLGGWEFRFILMAESLLRGIVPPAVLAFFLWTGLRSRSLRRSKAELPVMLPRDRFPQRGDWLALMMVILVSHGLADLAYLARLAFSGFPALMLRTPFTTGSWPRYAFEAGRGVLLYVVPGIWSFRIALRTWRDPGLIAGRLWRLFIFLAVAHAVDHAFGPLLLSPRSSSFPTTPFELGLFVLRVVLHLIDHLLPLLVLCCYASRVLPQVAVEQAKGSVTLERGFSEPRM